MGDQIHLLITTLAVTGGMDSFDVILKFHYVQLSHTSACSQERLSTWYNDYEKFLKNMVLATLIKFGMQMKLAVLFALNQE